MNVNTKVCSLYDKFGACVKSEDGAVTAMLIGWYKIVLDRRGRLVKYHIIVSTTSDSLHSRRIGKGVSIDISDKFGGHH